MPAYAICEHARRALRLVAMVCSGCLISACGGVAGGDPAESLPPPVSVQGLLVSAGSSDAFVERLKAAFTAVGDSAQADAVAVLGTSGAASPIFAPPVALEAGASTGFTTTYTQEADVDEFDVVKYDGERLFIAPRIGCCQVDPPQVSDALSFVQPPSGISAIRVLTTDPETATATETARIDLPQGTAVQGMYLSDDTLVALTSDSFQGGWGFGWLALDPWHDQHHGVQFYDISDPADPRLTFEARFEGSLIGSRRIGDTVYLFMRYTPEIDEFNYAPASESERARNAELVAAASVDQLLPSARINATERVLIDPANCLVTNSDPAAVGRSDSANVNDTSDGNQAAVLTVVTAIDINTPDQVRSMCYNEQAYGFYASSSSIYLMQLLWRIERNSSQTRIHKFDLASLHYQGSAEVDGLLWSGGHNDFRTSEHNEVLRIMTSQLTGDETDWIDHQLHTLRLATDRPELEVLATLPNAAAPAEIGKPNEDLYGVRFFGTRAYAVTFERIDPLYVFDLENPAAPALLGELEVSGFSDFLHPVSESLLLGFGRAEDLALKLELFDVSDVATPRSLAVELLGGPWSFSEALYNRHAFTYQPGVTRGSVTVDRFAVPADLYDQSSTFDWVESGLYLYEIGNLDTPESATLNAAGAVVIDRPDAARSWPVGNRYRSRLHGDAVFVIRNEEVFGALWSDPTNVAGPQ